MELCYGVCCGLDVHKKSVSACLRRSGPNGQRVGEAQPARSELLAEHAVLRLEILDHLTLLLVDPARHGHNEEFAVFADLGAAVLLSSMPVVTC